MITEEIFDGVVAPIAAAVALAGLDAQLEMLSDVHSELGDALAKWDSGVRERAVADFRRSLTQIREALDDFEACLPEEPAS